MIQKKICVNAIKEQVATIKENSKSVESTNQRSEKSKNQVRKAKPEKKSHIEIIGDTMLNGIHERDMNKDENIKVKIRKYQTYFTEITKTDYNTWWHE